MLSLMSLGTASYWILSTGELLSSKFALFNFAMLQSQFDALIEDMTSYELLRMYARLRGIPEDKIQGVVETEITRLDLTKHADRLCGTYR